MHTNRGYAMPETCEIEENFEILKGVGWLDARVSDFLVRFITAAFVY